MKIILFYFFLTLSISLTFGEKRTFSQENIYNFENSLLYAGYLLKTGQYQAASQELERIAFINPSSDSIKFLLVESYLKAENYSKGIKRTEEFFTDAANMPADFSISYSRMLLLSKNYEKLNNFTLLSNHLSEKEKVFFRFNASLMEKKWDQAKQLWDSSGNSLKISYPAYNHLVDDIPASKYKKPAIAGGLSALVPGSGKLYTNDWIDGMLSFVTIGALSFQAYRGFNSKGINSVYGWVFGTLAVGFYSGNIYGSFKAAQKYNSKIDENFFNAVEKEFAGSF